jgi:hypothetical protein
MSQSLSSSMKVRFMTSSIPGRSPASTNIAFGSKAVDPTKPRRNPEENRALCDRGDAYRASFSNLQTHLCELLLSWTKLKEGNGIIVRRRLADQI